MWTPESAPRQDARAEVKFHVSKQTHDEITAMTKRDVTFLQKWGLMDYSLVVSYHGVPDALGRSS